MLDMLNVTGTCKKKKIKSVKPIQNTTVKTDNNINKKLQFI